MRLRPQASSDPAPASRPAPLAAAPEAVALSVLIPSGSQVGHLGDTVASACAAAQQCDEAVEVVVVDGGPPHGPAASLADAGIEGLRYVSVGACEGAELWNRAVAEARGEFLVILDRDDLLLAGAPSALLTALRSAARPALAHGDVLVLTGELEAVSEAYWGEGAAALALTAGRWLPSAAVAMHRSIVDALGGFRPECTTGWFTDLVARAVADHPLVAVGSHTAGRRDQGFVEPDARSHLTVTHQLLARLGAAPLVGASEDAEGQAQALLEIGVQLMRLGDPRGALACFEKLERLVDDPNTSQTADLVRTALAEGPLATVEPFPGTSRLAALGT